MNLIVLLTLFPGTGLQPAVGSSEKETSAKPPSSLERFTFQEKQMGVDFTITVYAPTKAIANRATSAAFQRIKKLNGVLSDYDLNSELSLLGKISGPRKPVKISPDMLFVLSRSLALSKKTNGAFDITLGHLTRHWRRARRRKQLPKPDVLADALYRSGYQHVRLNVRNSTVELLKTGMRLDVGGIAKGYAADEAMKVLRRFGITRALVDGSGDICIGDPPPGKRGWKIGLASLKKPNGSPTQFLLLRNTAVATSGDAFQFVQIGGRRYSHIIDPKTGLGLPGRASVTVIAPNGTVADSLASAVSVLGVKRGLALIKSIKGAEVLVLRIENGKNLEASSAGFRCFIMPAGKKD
jgi:FAD:protein FMN transferase